MNNIEILSNELTLSKMSAVTAIVIFIGFIIYKWWTRKAIHLADIVITMIAAGMLPLAIGFVLYPFFPALIGSIEHMNLQITITGLVLIFVYSKTIFEKMINSS